VIVETVSLESDDPMPQFANLSEGVRQKMEWRMRRDRGIGKKEKLMRWQLHVAVSG
jgi:hypothetical protein